jgi:hypothetical protein
MDELERRLRSALTEMAEEVSPSRDAWVEQERRLALKSGRARVRPALMAAVAAAVVALIAIPVMVISLRPSQVEHGSIPGSESSEQPSTPTFPPSASIHAAFSNDYVPIPGEKLLTEPTPVNSTMRQQAGEVTNTVVYTVYRDSVGGPVLCIVSLPDRVKINGQEQAKYPPLCTPLKAPAKRLLWYQGAVPNGSGAYLYVMAPQVDTMLVRVDNGYRQAYRIAGTDEFALLLVSQGSGGQPKQYTARDKSGHDLENG